jgi:hypothetical protein
MTERLEPDAELVRYRLEIRNADGTPVKTIVWDRETGVPVVEYPDGKKELLSASY